LSVCCFNHVSQADTYIPVARNDDFVLESTWFRIRIDYVGFITCNSDLERCAILYCDYSFCTKPSRPTNHALNFVFGFINSELARSLRRWFYTVSLFTPIVYLHCDSIKSIPHCLFHASIMHRPSYHTIPTLF